VSSAQEHEQDAAVRGLSVALESLLFVADRPIPADRLVEVLEASPVLVQQALALLKHRLDGSGLMLQAVAGGYQLATRPEHADLVRRFLQREHGERLSRGALETLAVIAYRQPVTRAEIEQIRGVSADWHLERLLERQLIRVVGRRETIGRPILFGTTEFFLRYFGLRDLSALPAMGPQGVQTLLDAVR
jgi:segregation and condensation protein B